MQEPQSYLSFLFRALGIKYSLLLPLSAGIGLLVTLLVVVRGRGALSNAGLILAVMFPVFVGLFGVVEGILSSLQVMSTTTSEPRPDMIAEGVAMALVSAMIGMMLAVPSYLIALFGSTFRAFTSNPTS